MVKTRQPKTDKQALAIAFGKAVDSYDHFAGFQRDVGQKLLGMLPQGQLGKILDLGCGTGYFSACLLSQHLETDKFNLDNQSTKAQSVIALDLAPEMAKRAGCRDRQIIPIVGDADNLPFLPKCFDHAFSSLVLQWCDELDKPLAELKRVVKGSVVFSTLLDGSLHELAQSWLQVDGKSHINQFMSQEKVELALFKAGIVDYRLEVKTHQLYFENAKAVMADLKGIGANHLQRRELDTKGLGGINKLKTMYRCYEKLRTSDGLPLSYQVCYVICNVGSHH